MKYILLNYFFFETKGKLIKKKQKVIYIIHIFILLFKLKKINIIKYKKYFSLS